MVEALFAYLIADPDGNERVMALNPQVPLVGSEMQTMEKMKPTAQHIANHFGYSYKLVRFFDREVLGEFVAEVQ